MNDISNKQGEEPLLEIIKGIKPTSIICRSISECTFVSNFWRAHTDKEWTIKEEVDPNDSGNTKTFNNDKKEDDVAGISLETKTRLILSPQYNYDKGSRNTRNNNRNRNTRFHQDLKTDDLDGVVVMFQAKANESTAVILSSFPSYHSHDGTSNGNNDEEQKNEETETKDDSLAQDPDFPIVVPIAGDSCIRYEIVLGANKNTATTIRRSVVVNNCDKTKRSSKTESSSLVTIPSRVCRGFGVSTNRETTKDDDNDDIYWASYWVCLSNSKLYVGMGRIPGKQCFCVTENQEEEERKQEENPSGATEKTAATPLPIRYVGIGNDTKQHNGNSTEVRNLVVTNIPPCLESLLKELPSQDELPIVCLPSAASSSSMDIDEDTETLELKRFMEQYRDECLVRKRRAQKYGTQYKEQPMKDFLPWTMAKRLLLSKRLNQQTTTSSSSGFVAGDINFLDPKEVSKREARLARFAAASAASTETKTDCDGDENKAIKDGTAEMTLALAASITDGLAVEQAWDKEAILRPVRRDPPPYLWKECPSNAETIETFKNPPDPFTMYDETTKAANWIEDKLHVSAIDWAAFKQIGNEDLLKHFGESYGPIKFIEWLGDVNCNICFGSKYSTARALVCLSNELPSPPPPSTSLAALSVTPTDENDENNKDISSSATASTTAAIDLGCMNWRFGKKSIRKLSSDRRGRKGTTARYLLRMATTEDVLLERPNFWPEPPGGFSSDRVLGPKSDFSNNRLSKGKPKQMPQSQQNPRKQQQAVQQQNRRGSRKSKRKRQREENDDNNNNNHHDTNQNKKEWTNMNKNMKTNQNDVAIIGLLNRGLSSSRAGFSVEELEKERQAKKQQKTC